MSTKRNGRREKRPAFQLYAIDFLASESVALMTNEEVGVYIKLLCRAWSDHGVTADRKRLARLLGLTEDALNEMLDGPLGDCWEEVDGRLYNSRLELERDAADEHREDGVWAGKYGQAKRRGDVPEGLSFEDWRAQNDPRYGQASAPPEAPPPAPLEGASTPPLGGPGAPPLGGGCTPNPSHPNPSQPRESAREASAPDADSARTRWGPHVEALWRDLGPNGDGGLASDARPRLEPVLVEALELVRRVCKSDADARQGVSNVIGERFRRHNPADSRSVGGLRQWLTGDGRSDFLPEIRARLNGVGVGA